MLCFSTSFRLLSHVESVSLLDLLWLPVGLSIHVSNLTYMIFHPWISCNILEIHKGGRCHVTPAEKFGSNDKNRFFNIKVLFIFKYKEKVSHLLYNTMRQFLPPL